MGFISTSVSKKYRIHSCNRPALGHGKGSPPPPHTLALVREPRAREPRTESDKGGNVNCQIIFKLTVVSGFGKTKYRGCKRGHPHYLHFLWKLVKVSMEAWTLPWNLSHFHAVEARKLSWKLLPRKLFVEASREFTSKEASMKASTEASTEETSMEASMKSSTKVTSTETSTEASVDANLLPRNLSRKRSGKLSRKLSWK